MGRSSPPFLYDRPSTYSFNGPTDPGFNPKAVTQASWTRSPPKPKPKGPLIIFNKHPDTWGSYEEKSTWTPMGFNTKRNIKWARGTQLGLRSITLLGAIASLFCSIVIKNAATTIIWIIRAGPIAAALHTAYSIYHFSRSPVNRPAGSQASYGGFAATLDTGLIAFYVFTAYIAHGEWALNAYHWSTLFGNSEFTMPIAEATFICAIVNGGLHLISLGISVYLAVMFRKISQLPPDMNPLEDNLTARPRRSRKEIDLDEKHMSSSTLHSNLEDPLIGAPRTVPFMHTRGQSGDSHRGSTDFISEQRQSRASIQPHRLSHLEPTSPEMLFHHPASQPYDLTSETPAPEYRNVTMGSPEVVNPGANMRHMTSRAADRSNSRSPSPADEAQEQNSNNALRQSSSVYSRRTTSDATTNSGIRDWFAYGHKPASIGSVIPEDTRGEYAELAMHEYYGNEEDKREQDLGDTRFNIFPDPQEHDDDNIDDDHSKNLPFNPLMLNPPTPQPVLTEKPEDTDPVRRYVLSDNPNLSYNHNAQIFAPQESQSTDSTPTKGRFYGELAEEGMPSLDTSRDITNQKPVTRQPTKLVKKKSKKMSAYRSLKKDDSGDEGYLSSRSPAMAEGDRKGRVVSNSGADTARPGIGASVGASLSSYGSYIAGLGVGRRRDVSGKIAEEGRSSKPVEEHTVPVPTQIQSPAASPIRAAGWARFAGL
ncbi:hypothetical protein N7532_000770 [Penicillium argentinense]|uniref:Uncharacterized protein n=1 Tax=Penicillium argentinense TaxID=1131581 RepID=A0A9W9KNM6_9EURO|nr:uncharacterized protein N7532_000770 [Penicillium argentinense]KAJ5112725.1 hypothetical protein N7532_000770 [Penicillium argentinense]